jgi:beta-lactamase class D
MNIKLISIEYLQQKIYSKITKIVSDESYASYKIAREFKSNAKKIAINCLRELDYSNQEINTIINEYWPKEFLKIKHRFQLNYTNIEMLRHQYPPKKYKKYIMQRYHLAYSALEQKKINLNSSGQS